MSLEATIQENTNAIRELIKAIQSGVPTTAAQVEAVVEQAKPTKAKKTDKTDAPAPEVSDAVEQGKTAAQAVEALDGHANKPAPAATYEDCKAAILKISKDKGRDVAVQVLQRFGVAKLPELQPDSFDALVALSNEVLEGAQP